MKTLICCKTGKTVTLENKIGGGGEGAIWRTNQDGKLAKVYQEKLENIKIKKLKVMVDYPPTDPSKSRNHISYAWPESLLKDKNQIVGFLMPEIKGSQTFLKISNIKERKDSKLEIDWKFLHITAMNIANMIRNLHAEGYVVGDLKPDNIMVNSLALPSIVDTDSFQLRDPQSGNIYRCPVTSENFTPPEMIGENITEFYQTVYHDAFRLGALIYLLLTSQYYHQGQWCGTGEPPTVSKKIKEGLWPYGTNSLIKPSDFAIPLKVMHPRVQKLFLWCFNNGHNNPRFRPTADDWYKALEKAVNDLTQCNRVATHIYSQHYGKCYWCERAWKLKIDVFPPMSGYKFYNPTKTPPYDNLKKAETCNSSGLIYYNQGNYEKAIFEFNEAILLNPKYANAYNNRGTVYYDLGKYEKALADYNEAIQLNPKNDYFYNKRGIVYYDLGKYERALSSYNEALQLNPKCVEVYNNRGNVYYIQGKHEKAIANYSQALRINPKVADIYYNRGLNYKDNRNIKKAILDFGKAANLYKQEGNQKSHQKCLDELKGLTKFKLSSTIYNYPSTLNTSSLIEKLNKIEKNAINGGRLSAKGKPQVIFILLILVVVYIIATFGRQAYQHTQVSKERMRTLVGEYGKLKIKQLKSYQEACETREPSHYYSYNVENGGVKGVLYPRECGKEYDNNALEYKFIDTHGSEKCMGIARILLTEKETEVETLWKIEKEASSNTNCSTKGKTYQIRAIDSNVQSKQRKYDLEKSVFSRINQYRKYQNLPALQWSNSIAEEARIHAQQMASGKTTFSNNEFQYQLEVISKKIPYKSKIVSLNATTNIGYRNPGERAVEDWINNPVTHKNIVDDHNLTGIGIAQNSKGQYYISQLFIKTR
jgi:tetratricopeptide (TPR) repeat protein/uncharacterized protein YkwD